MVPVASWVHADVWGPKSVIHVATGCDGQRKLLWQWCVDGRFILQMRNIEDFYDIPHPHKGSYCGELLKMVTVMLSSTWMTSGGGVWERAQLSLMGWPAGVWPYSNVYMNNRSWTWCIFFPYEGRAQWWDSRSGRRNGKPVWSGCIVRFPNNH